MFTQKRRTRTLVLEVLDTRLSLSGLGGIAAAQVSMATAAGYVQLNPQPLPPRFDPSGTNLGGTMAEKLNPQPLPPSGGL